MKKLFKIFGRHETEESSQVNTTGIGLGLAISQKIVKRLNKNMEGFQINVESEYGKGALFTFPLLSKGNFADPDGIGEKNPNELGENKEVQRELKKFRRLGRTTSFVKTGVSNHFVERKLRVLVVDDDQINIIVVTKYLSQMKEFDFDTVFNGKEAFIKYKDHAEIGSPYDVILMDCNMPVMDGFEATTLILEYCTKKFLPKPSIIAITANTLQKDHQKCFSCGMVGYITKPFSKVDLKEKISGTLINQNNETFQTIR